MWKTYLKNQIDLFHMNIAIEFWVKSFGKITNQLKNHEINQTKSKIIIIIQIITVFKYSLKDRIAIEN